MVMKCKSEVYGIYKLRKSIFINRNYTILLDKETTHSKPCNKIFAYKTCVLVKSECNNPVEGLTINALEIHLFVKKKK